MGEKETEPGLSKTQDPDPQFFKILDPVGLVVCEPSNELRAERCKCVRGMDWILQICEYASGFFFSVANPDIPAFFLLQEKIRIRIFK